MPTRKDSPIQHKNIRGAEYYAQALEEPKTQTPILRLRQFVDWLKAEGLCSSNHDFEQQCGLANRYIANCSRSGRGDMGTDILARIVRRYPALNLAWLCTGEGMMLTTEEGRLYSYYKAAYEATMMQVEALNQIIGKK